ncbi:hypothetical protein JHK82_043103 [Glycine max]|uniref:Flavodoxin-like domain-containing protein n=1 Tax=Glycine max TaxID=3847 RepID=K7MCR3_SOYBN|nr:hypothetical protein JHK82_043103 [Glycine max]
MAVQVYIAYYSLYGHVERLAEEIKKGTNCVEGVEAKLWQFKAFLDASGGLWETQQLAGKLVGIFYSTRSQGVSLRKILRNINDEKLWDEYAWLTAIAQPVHHGMLFVPIGYTFSAGMFEMEELKGGSPYGSVLELEQAFHQGKYIANITKKLKEAA